MPQSQLFAVVLLYLFIFRLFLDMPGREVWWQLGIRRGILGRAGMGESLSVFPS
jgi:hypothetical protein